MGIPQFGGLGLEDDLTNNRTNLYRSSIEIARMDYDSVDFLVSTKSPEYNQASGTLSNVNIKALRATPITLVAASAGHLHLPLKLILKLNYGGTNAFTESADNIAIKYTDGSGDSLLVAETTGWITGTADAYSVTYAPDNVNVAAAGAEGQALVLHNNGDGEIAGNAGNDNTISWHLFYATIPAL